MDSINAKRLVRAGQVGLWSGIVGGLAAGLLLAWPAQVAPGPLRYPFSPTGFVVAQSLFFVHHLGLVFLVWALATSRAGGERRWARFGAWLALGGTLGLTFAELNTARFGEMDLQQANQGFIGAQYGISCNAIGLGLILFGAAVVRARIWSGWRRWMPLILGIATFVELTPGMFGGFVMARLAIGVWLLLFGALGLSLLREAGEAHPARHS